jgi:diaminopimelate decarboxylase
METYKWYYHLISASRAGETPSTKYKLAGPLCDGGDVYFDIEGANRLPIIAACPNRLSQKKSLRCLIAARIQSRKCFNTTVVSFR